MYCHNEAAKKRTQGSDKAGTAHGYILHALYRNPMVSAPTVVSENWDKAPSPPPAGNICATKFFTLSGPLPHLPHVSVAVDIGVSSVTRKKYKIVFS